MLRLLVFSTLSKEGFFDEKTGHKNTTVRISYSFFGRASFCGKMCIWKTNVRSSESIKTPQNLKRLVL